MFTDLVEGSNAKEIAPDDDSMTPLFKAGLTLPFGLPLGLPFGFPLPFLLPFPFPLPLPFPFPLTGLGIAFKTALAANLTAPKAGSRSG